MRPVRIATIGLCHAHVFAQTRALLAAGAELAAFMPVAEDLPATVQAYGQEFPQARQVDDAAAILERDDIDLLVCAAVPSDRAAWALKAMLHGKDVLVDKPGATTLAQLATLRQAQAASGRIWAVWFSERLAVRACTRATALVQAGAIGRVVQTIGLGPHRIGSGARPGWFHDRERTGGILCDIASHQFEQFLHYTGSTRATVLAAQARNLAHPAHPGLQDFGDCLLRGDQGSGYLRVDWLTTPGLPTWGDSRLTILGTEGHIELRKNIDLAGRPGAEHLFLANGQGVRHIDCSDQPLPFAAALLRDMRERSQTAMPQAHSFLATELALQAQQLAESAEGAA